MKLPNLNVKKDSVVMTNAFAGYNHNLRINDGEFYDTKNLTNDDYPVIGSRKKRGIVRQLTDPMGMLGGKYISFVDDNKFYYDESYVCDLEESGKERILVSMGAYICIFPDGAIYNTSTGEVSFIEQEVTTSEAPIFTLCRLDGTEYSEEETITSATEPDKGIYRYWIDTSSDPVVMKMYSENIGAWISVATTYVKITATGIGKGFRVYDAVSLEGVDVDIEAIYNDYDFNQSTILYDVGENYLVVAGFINRIFANSQPVTVKRKKPDMDFVIELDNRLWGCSSENHEIYACKLGDPTNWNFFMGTDGDSYAATVGSDNVFTGAASYLGYLFFFKEAGYHKVYGTKPSNFEISWKEGRGVQFGSDKSLAVVNDSLFFKSRDGICIYDGSIRNISRALVGNYYDAVACGYRDKYYVSMRDEDYQRHFFVYDSTKGTWIREDDTRALFMKAAENGMYVIDENGVLFNVSTEQMYVTIFPIHEELGEEFYYPNETFYPGKTSKGQNEQDFEWSLTTGEIGLESPYNKYMKRLNIRCTIETNANVIIEVMYDSSGDWEKIAEYFAVRKRSYEIPVSVKRCDHMQLRLSGYGDFKLYSIAKVYEEGSGIR